jgi:GT2 family glycosyltransferase
MNKPKVAYVIVCWNNLKILPECLESIYKQTYDNRTVIVVDNNSSDKTVEFIKAEYPKVRLLAQSSNLGFAKGNNVGIEEALKDESVSYVMLLNSDARLSEDWTEKVVAFAEKKPKGAAFQTVTLDYYDPSTVDSTHIYVARNGQATQGSWRRPILDGSDTPPRKVFGCNAAAVLYSRRFIEAQPYRQLFDETMFMYLEDVDVAARATVMGWDNYVVPGSRAYHMGSASSGKNSTFSLYMTYRNNGGMLVKNFPISILLRMLPRMFKSDWITTRHLWRQGRRDAVWALFKGRLVGLVYLPIFIAKRFKLARHHKPDSHLLWLLMDRGF